VRPRSSSLRLWIAAGALVLVVVSVLSDLGGAVAAWERAVSWLNRWLGFPPESLLVQLRFWLFALFVLVLAALVALLRWAVERSAAAGEEGRSGRAAVAVDPVRERYLRYLDADVENRLRSSIHGARFLDLGLCEAPGAAVPWHYVYQDPGSVQEVFGSFDMAFERFGRLLLLGDPGSGKTTTLLHFARRLIAEARRDPSAPVPVLLNLAGFGVAEEPRPWFFWLPGLRTRARAPEERSFEPWLTEQLTRLPVRGLTAAVARWLEEGRIALLLDGLDEVAESRAEQLLHDLNTSFLHRYTDLPTVVSSRVLEYQRLTADRAMRLQLNGAVTLQPLDRDQIHAYLRSAGATALRDALERDRDLYELAQTPLNLSLMTLAYADAPQVLPAGLSLTERRHHLFETYVEKMLQRTARRAAGKPLDSNPAEDEPLPYSLSEVNGYLGWLAGRLSERSHTSFAPGDLVRLDSGLKSFWSELRIAQLLLVFLFSATVYGIFSARAPLGRFSGLVALAGPASYLWSSAITWLEFRGFFGAALCRERAWLSLLQALALQLAFSLGSYVLLLYWALTALMSLLPWRASWLSMSMLASIFTTIYPTENWARRHRESEERVAIAVTGGLLLFILSLGLVTGIGWLGDRWIGPPTPALAAGMVVVWIGSNEDALIGAALGAVLGLLLRGPAGALVGVFLFPYVERFSPGTTRRWINRLFLQPLLTPLLVARGHAPWRYARFVRCAAAMLLLKKVGEEYEFTHRLLRDHFALRELVSHLYGERHEVRVAEVPRIAALGESSLGVLEELARDPDPTIRKAAVAGLCALSLLLPRVPLLLGTLFIRETDQAVRAQIGAHLAGLPRKTVKALLNQALEEDDADLRDAVVVILRAQRQEGRVLLRMAMAHPDPAMASAARRIFIAFLAFEET
jgi:energy-coupling factor transporter ATP-binding protein EcfA2